MKTPARFLALASLALAATLAAQEAGNDPAFGIDGYALTGWDPASGVATDHARAMAVQADGRILLGGSTTVVDGGGLPQSGGCALTRLHGDGSTDLGFGDAGKILFRFPAPVPVGTEAAANGCEIESITLDSQGRIVVAARQGPLMYVDAGGQVVDLPDHIGIARFTSAGLPDTGFAGDGRMHFNFQSDGYLSVESTSLTGLTVLALPDDALFVTATVRPDLYDHENHKVAAARITAAGGLDGGYHGDGKRVFEHHSGAAWFVSHAVLDSGGRMVLVGTVDPLKSPRMWIGRLQGSGLPDTSFGRPLPGSWYIDLALAGADHAAAARAVAIDSQGRFLLAGVSVQGGLASDVRMAIARLTHRGFPDSGFGTDGHVMLPFQYAGQPVGSQAEALAIDAEGRIVVSGMIARPVGASDETLFATARVQADSGIDPDYWPGGRRIVETDFYTAGPRQNRVGRAAMKILPTGRLLIAGTVLRGHQGVQQDSDFAVLALRGAPVPDLIFANGFQ